MGVEDESVRGQRQMGQSSGDDDEPEEPAGEGGCWEREDMLGRGMQSAERKSGVSWS
jgi:hypothetical protein